jgi:hypothetical protein
MGRPPYIFGGNRLYSGAELAWQGTKAKVTSLNGAGLVACTYKPRREGSYESAKIDKRFSIARDDLKAAEKGEQAPPNPERQRIERLLLWLPKTARRNPFCTSTKGILIGQYVTLKEAFLKNDSGCKMMSVLEWLWEHGGREGWKVLAFDLRDTTADQVRAAVDWDRDVLPYVEKILDRTKFVSAKPKETMPELVEA